MHHREIIDLLNSKPSNNEVIAKGWVRSFRSNRFIALNDGSTLKNLQCVVDYENFAEEFATILQRQSHQSSDEPRDEQSDQPGDIELAEVN